MEPKARRKKVLQSLNLFGWDHLDSIILAALADEQPLLLIGPHGTAKSELFNRLATALNLDHRHYNASLISFDDLLGYPIPNADHTALEYIRTPGDLWGAESVFLDEISRCRPEHQNKLFSIIHERRVQGLRLEKLRYRWSAMNPPFCLDGDNDEDESYTGSLPLDAALADRFPYVVQIPAFQDFDHDTRRRLIASAGELPGNNVRLAELVDETRATIESFGDAEREWAAAYVNCLVLPLRDAGFPISGRRAVCLARTIAAVYSASITLCHGETQSSSAYLALKCGLPHRAQGKVVSESKLKAVHRLALKTVGEPEGSVWHAIRSEKDPVRRVALALDATPASLGKLDFSQLVSDAYASLSLPRRYIFSRHVLPPLAHADRITAATYELVSEPLLKVAEFSKKKTHTISAHRSRSQEWDKLLSVVSRLKKHRHHRAVDLGNTLYTLFAVEEESFDPDTLVALDDEWRTLFTRSTSNGSVSTQAELP